MVVPHAPREVSHPDCYSGSNKTSDFFHHKKARVSTAASIPEAPGGATAVLFAEAASGIEPTVQQPQPWLVGRQHDCEDTTTQAADSMLDARHAGHLDPDGRVADRPSATAHRQKEDAR
jgi:hypothetical protein